jgi:hypothetical protein
VLELIYSRHSRELLANRRTGVSTTKAEALKTWTRNDILTDRIDWNDAGASARKFVSRSLTSSVKQQQNS